MSRFNIHHVTRYTYDEPVRDSANQVILFPIRDEYQETVCQEFAHMVLVMLRMINIPARYVSGYVCPNKNGMRGEGATHAWVEAYIPFYGWLGIDPTNNSLTSHLHVRLAVGRSFSDVSPVKGTYKGTSRHVLEVGVTVAYENGEQPL